MLFFSIRKVWTDSSEDDISLLFTNQKISSFSWHTANLFKLNYFIRIWYQWFLNFLTYITFKIKGSYIFFWIFVESCIQKDPILAEYEYISIFYFLYFRPSNIIKSTSLLQYSNIMNIIYQHFMIWIFDYSTYYRI